MIELLKDLHCRMELAIKYGADAAIFLNNIVYWISPHEAEEQHFYEGRYWMNASIQGFSKLYPLWSVPQLKRMISKLRDDGALLVGDFNEDRMDRTKWYSVSDEIMSLYAVDENYFTCQRQ